MGSILVVCSESYAPKVEPFLTSIALNVLPQREWLTKPECEYDRKYHLVTGTLLDYRRPD